jgi:hypothetical protein
MGLLKRRLRTMNLRILSGLGLTLCWIAGARTGSMSGTVTDESGKPLPGIAVYAL